MVHCHGHISLLYAAPAAYAARIPMLCELHGLYVPSQPGSGRRPVLSRFAKALELRSLLLARRVLCQSSQMKRRLLRDSSVAERSVHVLYPGLLCDEFIDPQVDPCLESALDARYAGRVVVAYVGSIHPYQGLELLLDVHRRFSELHPETVLLLLLSADGSEAQRWRDRNAVDPQNVVIRTDVPSRDLPTWLRRADILVHTRPDVPDNINVQSKLGIYLAAGKPIVATDVGDYRTLLGDLPGCFLAKPTIGAILEALRLARSKLSDDAFLETARTKNRAAARRWFDLNTNAEELSRIYYQMIGRSIGTQ